MKNRFLIVMTILLALAGCSNESSVTGTSDHVLIGQIVAAGTLATSQLSILSLGAQAGSPVVGVEVRAVGVGVFSMSDGSGRFSLVGLPPTVDLTFKRSDGINASARVDVRNLPVVTVELSKTTANVTASGQAKQEIEGLITAVSTTSITVNDASTHGPVTAAITAATVIRHGDTTVLATALKQGDRVHVRALITVDGLMALEIKLQNPAEGGDNNPAVQQLEGLIVSISATEITVSDASRHADVTAKITDATAIRKGNNSTLLWSDLKPGDRVHVKATGTGSDLTAVEIKLQNPA